MSTSNFSDINTPNDLVKANKQSVESPVEDRIMDLLMDLTPAVGLKVAIRTLLALQEFHETGRDHYQDEGNITAACTWHADSILIGESINLIKDIEL